MNNIKNSIHLNQMSSYLNLINEPSISSHHISYFQNNLSEEFHSESNLNINHTSSKDDNFESFFDEQEYNKENTPENNNSIQTPIMNFDVNGSFPETEKINIKSENISLETKYCSLTSKNEKFEIIPKIENIVSTAYLNCPLNLREITLKANNAEYNPKRFSAVIMKIKEPKTTALIFSNGRIVCLGAKTEEDSKKACRKFAKIIKKLGYPVVFKKFKIQNIVGSCDVKFQISLTKLYFHIIKKSSHNIRQVIVYEPEQFPGLIYRMIDPNILLLIFTSGKIILAGGKIREDIYSTFQKIYPLLNKFKFHDIFNSEKPLQKESND